MIVADRQARASVTLPLRVADPGIAPELRSPNECKPFEHLVMERDIRIELIRSVWKTEVLPLN